MTTKAEYYRGVTGEIAVSVREARIVVERFLSVVGVPMGAVAPIRDVIVDAQALGLPALEHLGHDLAAPQAFRAVHWSVADPGTVSVDGHGLSACLVAPDVLDLAVAYAHRLGAAVVEVGNVAHPHFLAALTASAHLYGVHLGVGLPSGDLWVARGATREPLVRLADAAAGASEGVTRIVCTVVSRGHGDRADSAAVQRALRDGFTVDAELWWTLWDRANQALAPDSMLSRTHAGASVYDDAGRLLGELGEEWDDGYVPPGGSATEVSSIARTRRPEDAKA
jgi:hypothetical protein